MKILMLTPYLPYPPSSGGQVRSYNLIKHLSKEHDIYLVSLIKKEEEEKFITSLQPFCKEIHLCKRSETPWTISNVTKSILGSDPFLVVRNSSKESKKTIAKLLKKVDFDLIHAETFYIMPHIPQTNVPILLVEQTIEYRVYQHYVRSLVPIIRPLFYYDILKLQRSEKNYWQKADLVGAVSEDDKKSMRNLLPGLKIVIIPNAAGEDLVNIYTQKHGAIKPIFLYQGNFSWLQNVEAAEILINDVFPIIKSSIPAARCIIAGQNAKQKLGTSTRSHVEIIDIRPDDIASVVEVYQRASIFIAPIEGPGGTRLKILGAMAAGLPVISSKTGVSGLEVTNDKNVLIAHGKADFATEAITLLNDEKKFYAVRTAARDLVMEKYSWSAISMDLEKIYRKLISTRAEST